MSAGSILLGACLITLGNAAGPRSVVILYHDLMERFGTSAAATATVGSLLTGTQVIAGKTSYC